MPWNVRSPWQHLMTGNLSLTINSDTQPIPQLIPQAPSFCLCLMVKPYIWLKQRNECCTQHIHFEGLRYDLHLRCGHARQSKSLKFYEHFNFQAHLLRSNARQSSSRPHHQHSQWCLGWNNWVWRGPIPLDHPFCQLCCAWRNASRRAAAFHPVG